MSFDTELENNRNHIVNIVFVVHDISGDVYFSKRQVDSGLVVDDDKKGLVDSVSVPPTTIDLRRAKQNISPIKIKVLDKDEVFSSFIGSSISALSGLQATVYVGLITGSYDFSEYVKIGQYTVGNITTQTTMFDLDLRPPESILNTPIYNTTGNLNASINDTQTSIAVATDGDIFPSSGHAKIGAEIVFYASKTFLSDVTTFNSVTRGSLSTVAKANNAGVKVIIVESVTENPINLLLQIMTSTGNGTNGAYDVLKDGAGLDINLIDVASFDNARLTYFPSDTFTLNMYDISSALTYIEKELLQGNNTRLISIDGKLGISVLDQSDPNEILEIIDAETIYNKSKPSWKLNQNTIVNVVEVQYFWNEGTADYSRTISRVDQSSIDRYGERRGKLLQFKGITSDSIAIDRLNRYLSRFSTPEVTVTTDEYLKHYKDLLGSKINLRHDDLPGLGSGRGLDAEVEILKVAIDYARGSTKKTYVFTSYTNLRRGRIAPSSSISTVTDLKTFTVPSGQETSWKVGYRIRLYDSVLRVYDSQINEIASINGTEIKLVDNMINITSGLKIVFPLFGNQAKAQQSRYMSIVGPTGIFSDGSGGFRIF